MPTVDTILILGAGLAGVTAAGALRDLGFAGRLILLGEEPELPYDRPPLSKSVLVHDELEQLVATNMPGDIALRSPEQIALRPRQWYSDHQIELMLGQRAMRLDTAGHLVELRSGESVTYDRLLLTPGARVRRLQAMETGPVQHLYLRTLSDALELRHQLTPGCKLVLLGGGVIGMEVAASAVLRGCDVTVVEMAPRIMSRALCESVSEHLTAYHRSKGVKLHLSAQATGQASGDNPGLALGDGSVIPADLIVIGIGIVPNIELARDAGLDCDDGIVVDEYGATSATDVFAAGDAVKYPDQFFGCAMRSENWMHAQNQALAVAKNMLQAKEPYRQVPHMWSDQYDLKIQVAGQWVTDRQVVRGDPDLNKFMIFHLADDLVIGATGVNEARDIKFAQKIIEAQITIDPENLADPDFKLKKALSK